MRKSIVGATKIFYPLTKALSYFSSQSTKRKKFSSQVQSTIMNSREEALRRDHDSIRIEHLLLPIIKQSQGRTVEILNSLGCDLTRLQCDVEETITNYTQRKPNAAIPFSKQAGNVLRLACGIADKLGSQEIENEHLFLSILKQESNLLPLFYKKFGISYEVFYSYLKKSSAN